MQVPQETDSEYMKRYFLAVLALAIVIVAAFIARSLITARPNMQATQQTAAPPLVTTSLATPGTVSLSLHSQGSVRSKQKLQLTSDLNGRIIWMSDRFQEGEFVDKAEPLLKIDPTNFQLAQAQAKLALREAELSLADALTRFKQSSTPKHPQLKRAEAQVEAARAQLKKAETDLSRTIIITPFPAIISSKHVAVGQFVNSSASLGELHASSIAEIALPFAYRDLKLLESNPELEIRLYTDTPGQEAEWFTQTYRLNRKLDEQTRVAYVIAEVLDPYALHDSRRPPLYIGQYVKAEIDGIVLQDAIELPLTALYEEQFVYRIDKDQRLRRTPVDIVRYTENSVIIGSGLLAGDRIVLTRLNIMAEGMKVQVEEQTDFATNSHGQPQ